MKSILKKCLTVSLLFACSGVNSYGKGIDEATAKRIGCNFLKSTYSGLLNTPADLSTNYVATDQGNFGPIVDYYVFSVNGGHGFIMVSGDDIIEPVLAYSNESVFDINNMAPATKDWIDGYKNQITAAVKNNIPASPETIQEWANLSVEREYHPSAARTTSVFPSSSVYLLKTKWDQAPGYNNKCPVTGTSGTPTGCVATSTAQVMFYWKWPAKGSGYHTYTHATYGAQKADFAGTAYGWSTMNTASSTTSTAILMYHVGVGVDMNYTTSSSGSGAYTLIAESPKVNCSEYALKTYFHYKKTLHGVQRYSPTMMSTSAWNTLLKTDLDANRPILYSGQGSAGGHAWVCDGYDASNKFHMNWGWSGSSDGYYTVDNLAPPSLGIGGGGGNFNSYQSVIMGIEPDSFATNSNDNIKMASMLTSGTTLNVPVNYILSTCTFTASVTNTNSTGFSGDIALQVFDGTYKLVTTLTTLTSQSIAAGATASLSFANTANQYVLVPGYYKFRIMYRNTGGSSWTAVGDNGTFINEDELTIGNDQSIQLGSNITPVGGTVIPWGSGLTVTATVANQSTGNFNGSVRAVLTNVATGAQTVIENKSGQTIYYASSTPYTFTTPTVSVTPGTYTLAIQHATGSSTAYNYTGATYYTNPVVVKIGSVANVNSVSLAESKISIFPNPASTSFNIDLGGVAASNITLTDIQGHLVTQFDATNSQGVINIPVNDYAVGMYFVNVYAGNEIVTKKIVVSR